MQEGNIVMQVKILALKKGMMMIQKKHVIVYLKYLKQCWSGESSFTWQRTTLSLSVLFIK